MPMVHIEMIEGRTVEQKRTLAKKITDMIVEDLKVKPEAVTVVFRDMRKDEFARGGVLRCDQ